MRSISEKRILITGGAGFIGSHLADAILDAGAQKVVVVDNFFLGKMKNLDKACKAGDRFALYRDDVRDLGTMKAIIRKERIEVIFNLATIALNYSFFNPYGAYRVNIDIAEVLLHLLEDGAYKTLIHSSSSEAYGTARYSPMDEKHPLNPTTPYAAGKAAADLLIQSFANILHGIDISIIRPFNNYGPRQNDQQLAAIIPITLRRIREGEAPVIEGTGEQTRDFIYVADTVRAFIMAYENESSRGCVINLGSGKEISMNELIECIVKEVGYMGQIIRNPARKADVQRLCASAKLAQELLGFEPDVNISDGLKQTIEWYRKENSCHE